MCEKNYIWKTEIFWLEKLICEFFHSFYSWIKDSKPGTYPYQKNFNVENSCKQVYLYASLPHYYKIGS